MNTNPVYPSQRRIDALMEELQARTFKQRGNPDEDYPYAYGSLLYVAAERIATLEKMLEK